MLLDSKRPVAFNPDADRRSELAAPVFVRDQFAFAALCQKAAFDQHSRHFRQTQNSEPRALDATVVLGDVSEERMINTSRKRHALRIDLTARLHVERTRTDRAVRCGWRSARRERKDFEPGGVRVVIRSIEVNADENRIARLIRDLCTHFQRHEIIAFAGHDDAQPFRLQNRAELSSDVECKIFFVP